MLALITQEMLHRNHEERVSSPQRPAPLSTKENARNRFQDLVPWYDVVSIGLKLLIQKIAYVLVYWFANIATAESA